VRNALSRRAVLRGVSGVVALPLLEAMAQAVPPRRFVVVFSPNGTVYPSWLPTGTETGFTLSPILAPLQPHLARLLVLGNLNVKSADVGPGDGHQKGIAHLLTATEMESSNLFGFVGWAGGISVDQQIAKAVGGQTRFPSLELGVQVPGAKVYDRLCYAGAAKPLPPMDDPHAVFERLFGGDTDPAAAAKRKAQRKSVLDGVKADLAALSPRVSAADRLKLDGHLTSVRELELRLAASAAPGPSCARPADPGAVAVTDPLLFPAIGKLQTDLLVMALACDLTRVASLQWSSASSPVVFSWLGMALDHHELSHRADSDATAQGQLVAMHKWYAEQFAYLLSRMEAANETGGSLLDHSAVLWGNELGKGNTHSHDHVPFVLAGSASGYFRTGRLIDAKGASHSDLLVSCLNAMGVAATTFGNPAYCSGPLPGLR
jgi:hypothetical protein